MELLAEIECQPGLDKAGKMLYREAVRAVIHQDGQLLMIHSARNGEYKFPGGGIEPGETHLHALARELREECGAKINAILSEFGKVIEYDRPQEEEFVLFKMASYYYVCKVDPVFAEPCLDKYEADLGFEAVWIGVEAAIAANERILASAVPPRWTKRERYVLGEVQKRLSATP